MGHITHQYGPYYLPIWAILLTRHLHIPKGGEPNKTERMAFAATFFAFRQ